MHTNALKFFEFHYLLKEAKLSRHGQTIEMRNKLHQLIAYFLQHPNQAISKDELLNAIWAQGEYREKSLSQSILELRKVLGDSTADPKYIRTVPNQGYIWIAPITRATKSRSHYLIASLVSLALLVIVGLLFWSEQSNFSFSEKDELVIGIVAFDNKTAQPRYQWIEYGLSDMLATDLIQFDGIDIINPSELPGNNTLTSIPELIKSENLDIVIVAEFSQAGSSQNLHYTLIASDLSQVSGQFQAKDIAFAMPELASRIHKQLRPDSQLSLKTYEWQINAMHEYAKGQHTMVEQGCELAQHYFAAAFVIDPSHYWSHLQWVFCQLELNQNEAATKGLVALSTIEIDDSFSSLKNLALAQLAVNRGEKAQAMMWLTKSAYRVTLKNNAQWLALGKSIEHSIAKIAL